MLDPEVPVLTIEDLGILRDVPRTTRDASHVQITPTYSGCPAMEAIRDRRRRPRSRAAGLRRRRRRVRAAPAWTTDWMTDEGRRQARRSTASRRPTGRAPATAPVAADAVGALPAVRLARHPRAQPVRLDRLQVAVGVQRLPGAVRPLQGALSACPRTPCSTRCGSRAVEPLTDDAVAITFDVPDELRDDYAFTHGQHLTIRGRRRRAPQLLDLRAAVAPACCGSA